MTTTIQAATSSALIRYRFVPGTGRRDLLLRSPTPFDAPVIFPGCPAPVPGPTPDPEPLDGYGSSPVKVSPLAALTADDTAAGWVYFPQDDDLYTDPAAAAAGPDRSVPIKPGPVSWAADVAGLVIEARAVYTDPGATGDPAAHDYWIGLESEDGQNAVLLGIFGSRALGTDPTAVVAYVKLGGVVELAADMLQLMSLPAPGEGVTLRLELLPVGGGVADRRAVYLRYRSPSGDWSVATNEFNSMDPLSGAQWAAISTLLQSGELRPVVKIGQRLGGAVPGGASWAFHRVRFA